MVDIEKFIRTNYQKIDINFQFARWTPDNSLQYEDTVLFFGKALLDMKRELELQRAEVKRLWTNAARQHDKKETVVSR